MPIPSYFQPSVKAPKRTVQSDLAEGIKKEDDLLPLLWEHFNDKSIVKVTDKFSPYDFESLDKGTKFELKSRNNSSATYDTTMVGASKVRCASSLDHKFYFIFVEDHQGTRSSKRGMSSMNTSENLSIQPCTIPPLLDKAPEYGRFPTSAFLLWFPR
jgi:hypothetical protein